MAYEQSRGAGDCGSSSSVSRRIRLCGSELATLAPSSFEASPPDRVASPARHLELIGVADHVRGWMARSLAGCGASIDVMDVLAL